MRRTCPHANTFMFEKKTASNHTTWYQPVERRDVCRRKRLELRPHFDWSLMQTATSQHAAENRRLKPFTRRTLSFRAALKRARRRLRPNIHGLLFVCRRKISRMQTVIAFSDDELSVPRSFHPPDPASGSAAGFWIFSAARPTETLFSFLPLSWVLSPWAGLVVERLDLRNGNSGACPHGAPNRAGGPCTALKHLCKLVGRGL